MASNKKKDRKPGSASSADSSTALSITLQHGRTGHLGWLAFGLVAGILLVWKLGSVGQFVGLVLLVIAAFQAYKAVVTFLHEPGTFTINGDSLQLPQGLCAGKEITLTSDEIQQAFFLRRAVPWTQTGPVLVVETNGVSYCYPRDWFASETDQQRVATALYERLAKQ